MTWPDPLLDDGAADFLSPSDLWEACFAWCVADVPDPELPELELEPELPEPAEPVLDVLDAAAAVCVLPGSA